MRFLLTVLVVLGGVVAYRFLLDVGDPSYGKPAPCFDAMNVYTPCPAPVGLVQK